MKILFYDHVQASDADAALKDPSLANKLVSSNFTIAFDSSFTADCVGIGNTDATEFTIGSNTVTLTETGVEANGLYLLDTPITGSSITVTHNGTFIGRIAFGKYVELGLGKAREIGHFSTHNPRLTASGNVVVGAGGIVGRKQGVDVRYKIGPDEWSEIDLGKSQIGKGFPQFILFDAEYNANQNRFPWPRLYAQDLNRSSLYQSSINKFLYSRKYTFQEAF